MSGKTPGALNLAIMAGMAGGLCLCLWLASHTQSAWAVIPAVIVFALLGNTGYALMHEAVHGNFHDNPVINENAGRILAGFFPTAFALQRVFHLAHHKNNRSEHERFDYYAPHENKTLKFMQWYCILTGLYWLAPPLFCVIYFFLADLLRWRTLFGHKGAWFARQTSAQEFLDALSTVPVWRVRLDIAVTAVIQFALIFFLDVSFLGWVLCYAAFGFAWSSLQYTDHAFSELDQYDGAWNLKVSPLVRWIFLNYHCHRVHHQKPSIPWNGLPALVRAGEANPTFWSIYLKMWRGPRPLPSATSGHF
jgi:fatty acid desaturase